MGDKLSADIRQRRAELTSESFFNLAIGSQKGKCHKIGVKGIIGENLGLGLVPLHKNSTPTSRTELGPNGAGPARESGLLESSVIFTEDTTAMQKVLMGDADKPSPVTDSVTEVQKKTTM